GFVHRDLKPSNVLVAASRRMLRDDDFLLLARNEQLQLSDFGLAKDVGQHSGLTQGAGTFGYMAPEQLGAVGVVDRRADLYAATVLIAELAAGTMPDPELRVSGGEVLTGTTLHPVIPAPLRSALLRNLD